MKTVYEDNFFTFTEDDLYISGNDRLYVYLNIDKYFKLEYSKLSSRYRHDDFTSFHAKKKRKKLIKIGEIKYDDSFFIPSNKEYFVASKIPFAAINSDYGFFSPIKILPADCTSMNLAPSSIKQKSYDLKKQFNSYKNKNRHFRTGRQDMNIKKYYNSKKFPSMNNMMHIINSKSESISYHYRKAKPFSNIYSHRVVTKPLNYIENVILCFIRDNTDEIHSDETYWAFNELQNGQTFCKNDRKKYRLVRMLYVLIMIGKYNDARLLLVNRTTSINHKNPYTRPEGSMPEPCSFHVKQKTIDKYKKEFDLLYYHIGKYTYSDIKKIDKYIDDYKQLYAIDGHYTNNVCVNEIPVYYPIDTKDSFSTSLYQTRLAMNHNLYEKIRYLTLSCHSYERVCLSLENRTFRCIHTSIARSFKYYEQLAYSTRSNIYPRTFIYSFLKRAYNNIQPDFFIFLTSRR